MLINPLPTYKSHEKFEYHIAQHSSEFAHEWLASINPIKPCLTQKKLHLFRQSGAPPVITWFINRSKKLDISTYIYYQPNP